MCYIHCLSYPQIVDSRFHADSSPPSLHVLSLLILPTERERPGKTGSGESTHKPSCSKVNPKCLIHKPCPPSPGLHPAVGPCWKEVDAGRVQGGRQTPGGGAGLDWIRFDMVLNDGLAPAAGLC